jgi:hypothetical protein
VTTTLSRSGSLARAAIGDIVLGAGLGQLLRAEHFHGVPKTYDPRWIIRHVHITQELMLFVTFVFHHGCSLSRTCTHSHNRHLSVDCVCCAYRNNLQPLLLLATWLLGSNADPADLLPPAGPPATWSRGNVKFSQRVDRIRNHAPLLRKQRRSSAVVEV